MTNHEKVLIYEKVLKRILFAASLKNQKKLDSIIETFSSWSFNSFLTEEDEMKQWNIFHKIMNNHVNRKH